MRPSSQSQKPRRDGGEDQIIETFRKLGWSVIKSPPLDLIIAKGSRTVLIEVKDGSKIPSRQKLTDAERDFIRGWRGEVLIVRSVEDARAVTTAAIPANMKGQVGFDYRSIARMRDEIRAIQAEPKS